MDSIDFIIDEETLDTLTALLHDYNLYGWEFSLNGKIINIYELREIRKDFFGYPVMEKVMISSNVLKDHLKGLSLMEIRKSIKNANPCISRYFSGDINILLTKRDRCNEIIKFLDDKINEIKFKKLFEENASLKKENGELKEVIHQINDKFLLLADTKQINNDSK